MKLKIPAKTFRRRGKLVHRRAYLRSDVGKPGRTPISERWYHPKVETGWEKDMPAEERRKLMLDAHGGDYLAAARALQALANVTQDRTTRARAAADARYFYLEYRKYK